MRRRSLRTLATKGRLALPVSTRPIVIGMALLIVIIVLAEFLVEGFLSSRNMRSILLLAAFLGLAAIGQTFVALLGALDLSIPYLIGAANILLPSLMVSGWPAWAAMAFVIFLGFVAGVLNGLLSYSLQGQALIVSLGFGFAVVGATQIYTSIGSKFGGTVFAQIPDWLRNLAAFNGETFGFAVPPVIVIWHSYRRSLSGSWPEHGLAGASMLSGAAGWRLRGSGFPSSAPGSASMAFRAPWRR